MSDAQVLRRLVEAAQGAMAKPGSRIALDYDLAEIDRDVHEALARPQAGPRFVFVETCMLAVALHELAGGPPSATRLRQIIGVILPMVMDDLGLALAAARQVPTSDNAEMYRR